MESFSKYISSYGITRLACGVAIGVIVAGCTPSASPIQSRWETYHNARFGFEFPYPSDWIALEPPTNRDGRAFRHPTNPDIEIRGWGRLELTGTDSLQNSSLNLPEAGKYNLTTDQGLPAMLEVEVGKKLSTMTLTLEEGDIIYQWQARSPKDKFADYYEAFYYIARNYRVPISPKEPS